MKYHVLTTELRTEVTSEKFLGRTFTHDEQYWAIVCTTPGCDHIVRFGEYPYGTAVKMYEIAHNLQRAMEEVVE